MILPAQRKMLLPATSAAHALHVLAAFLFRHLQRLAHGAGHLLDGKRVDQNGILQLAGRSREIAEDQHAVVVEAAGDEFLGDEVHAVVQRRHDAEVRQPMQGHHLRLRETAS